MGGARNLLLKAWEYGKGRRIFHVFVLVIISVALQVALSMANNAYDGSCGGYGCSIPCNAYGYGYGGGYISCYGPVGCDAYSGYGGYGFGSCSAYVSCDGYVGEDGYVGCDAYSYGGGSVACDGYIVCGSVGCDAYTFCPPPSTSCDAYPGSCLPDLEVIGFGAADVTPSNQGIYLSWSVKNQGADFSHPSPWFDGVYLSNDALLDPGDTHITSFYRYGMVGSGTAYAVSVSGFLPYRPDGDYYLIVKTDDNQMLLESDENNNTMARAIRIQNQPPDLVATGISSPDAANSQYQIDISWNILNEGGVAAGSWYDGLFLSQDANLDPDDLLIDWKYHDSGLYAGSGYVNQSTLTLPEWPDGTYYLFASTDFWFGMLAESNENNNVFSRQITIDNSPPEFLNVVATATCDGAVVNWETNEPATTSALDWCCDPLTGFGHFVFEGSSSELTTTHQMAITGLPAGHSYYFRAYSQDKAGNPMMSTIGTFSVGAEKPELRLSWGAVYWDSFGDYLIRRLSVDYALTNAGADQAENVQMTASAPSPTVVSLDSALPLQLGGLAPGESAPFTLAYTVPGGINTIIVANQASAEDSCGNTFSYP